MAYRRRPNANIRREQAGARALGKYLAHRDSILGRNLLEARMEKTARGLRCAHAKGYIFEMEPDATARDANDRYLEIEAKIEDHICVSQSSEFDDLFARLASNLEAGR